MGTNGIGPSHSVSQAAALPLSYAPRCQSLGLGIKPPVDDFNCFIWA